jgi:ADP-heptose:LPS heptosyltransferase
MKAWDSCKKILCVRLDNMGDLLMSVPAINALKETFGCSITVLTSSAAAPVVPLIPFIDGLIVSDVPWVKQEAPGDDVAFLQLVEKLKAENFDAAVIFTVFSQNPLPSALLLTLAGIPRRLAYCRENPYGLLTEWVPEQEPYSFIRHQVRRDLDLVKPIGASTDNEAIQIRLPEGISRGVKEKIFLRGIGDDKPWIIIHPGVSELKREYPVDLWIAAGKLISQQIACQLLVTGSAAEHPLCDKIQRGIDENAFNLAGVLSVEEFAGLIQCSDLVISVNTATAHFASAVQQKAVILYALTNPQHPPWKTIGNILPFSVEKHLQSKNEILKWIQQKYYEGRHELPTPAGICHAAVDLLTGRDHQFIPELVMMEPILTE